MAHLRETFSQNLVSGAASFNYSPNYDVYLLQVLITASTGITEVMTITFDSADGSDYDTVLATKQLSSESEALYAPGPNKILFKKGDKVQIDITNANTTGVVYGTVIMEVA